MHEGVSGAIQAPAVVDAHRRLHLRTSGLICFAVVTPFLEEVDCWVVNFPGSVEVALIGIEE